MNIETRTENLLNSLNNNHTAMINHIDRGIEATESLAIILTSAGIGFAIVGTILAVCGIA